MFDNDKEFIFSRLQTPLYIFYDAFYCNDIFLSTLIDTYDCQRENEIVLTDLNKAEVYYLINQA